MIKHIRGTTQIVAKGDRSSASVNAIGFYAAITGASTGAKVAVSKLRLGRDGLFCTLVIGLHQPPTLCERLYKAVFVTAFYLIDVLIIALENDLSRGFL